MISFFLTELEKMRYLSLGNIPSLDSTDPTDCSMLEITLSEDFDYTVPDPKGKYV
jgi:hypothetical protein